MPKVGEVPSATVSELLHTVLSLSQINGAHPVWQGASSQPFVPSAFAYHLLAVHSQSLLSGPFKDALVTQSSHFLLVTASQSLKYFMHLPEHLSSVSPLAPSNRQPV